MQKKIVHYPKNNLVLGNKRDRGRARSAHSRAAFTAAVTISKQSLAIRLTRFKTLVEMSVLF